MNDLFAPTPSSKDVGAPAPAVDTMVRAFYSAREEMRPGDFALPRLPREDERAAIVARGRALADAMAPFDRTEADRRLVAQAISGMLGGYLGTRVGGDQAREMVAGYCALLRGLPSWAVLAACDKIRRADPEIERKPYEISLRFPPTEPQLHRLADDISRERAEELAKIRAVLAVNKVLPKPGPAPTAAPGMPRMPLRATTVRFEPDAAERAHAAELERLRDERIAKEAATRERGLLAEYEAAGVEPVRSTLGVLISLSLARQLGLKARPEAAA